MIFQNYLIIVTSILILKKINGVDTNKFIRIFEENNNYPRALNLNNKVIAFSGYKSGKITEFDEFADEINSHINFLEYDSNIDIKGVDNKNFIMVWGKNTKLKIVYCDSVSWNYNITLLDEEIFYSTTYKINILPINSESVIISWINNGLLYINSFDLKINKFEKKEEIISGSIIDVNFISCINVYYLSSSFSSTGGIEFSDYKKDILCEYINVKCIISFLMKVLHLLTLFFFIKIQNVILIK